MQKYIQQDMQQAPCFLYGAPLVSTVKGGGYKVSYLISCDETPAKKKIYCFIVTMKGTKYTLECHHADTQKFTFDRNNKEDLDDAIGELRSYIQRKEEKEIQQPGTLNKILIKITNALFKISNTQDKYYELNDDTEDNNSLNSAKSNILLSKEDQDNSCGNIFSWCSCCYDNTVKECEQRTTTNELKYMLQQLHNTKDIGENILI